MKALKTIWILIFFVITICTLAAVDINDPSDSLYKDLEIWQEKGYLGHLPVIKPYPLQLIISLLHEVEEQGNGEDLRIAEFYLSQVDLSLQMDLALDAKLSMRQGGDEWLYGGFLVGIKGSIIPELTLWGELGGNLIYGYEDPYYTHYSFLPYGQRTRKDLVEDTGKVGPFRILQGLNSNIAYGSDKLYVSAGISRNSYGAINRDSIVLSSQAPQAGRMDFTWRGDNFSYSVLMLQLLATNGLGEDATTGKYLFMHSYNWAPFSWLDMGFVETVVGSFQAVYLIPFSELFYSQGLYGFIDNSQMGLTLRGNLPYNLEINGAFYMDDVSFNEYIKFNFESKLKAAFQGGLAWTPAEKWLYRFNMDYTMITPYMYTHEQYSDQYRDGDPTEFTYDSLINMTNYTHNGQSLGASLSPNSDRVYGELQFRPAFLTDIYVSGSFMRHANGSVRGSNNLADPEEDNDVSSNEDIIHDGSIFDDGISDNGVRTFEFLENRFMDQDVIEKVLQLRLGMETDLPMPFMDENEYYRMRFSLDYAFEMMWNSSRGSAYGVSPVEGNDEINHYVSTGIRLMF